MLSIIIFCIIVCAVVVILFVKQHKEVQLIETVTPRYCGEWSERRTVFKLLRMGIDPRAIFHNCYIKRSSGTYTQVDLVVATKSGLLAFEIKDYSGWIFGDFRQKYWAQVLAYGKEKHRFYNPIMQNNGHIEAIRENLPHNPGIPIYSIIVFWGNCTLKNVTVGSDNDFLIYPNEIERTVQDILCRSNADFGDKYEIMNMLTQAVANGNNPDIVSSQLMTALKAGYSCPASSYHSSYSMPFHYLRRFNRW